MVNKKKYFIKIDRNGSDAICDVYGSWNPAEPDIGIESKWFEAERVLAPGEGNIFNSLSESEVVRIERMVEDICNGY